MSGDLPFQTGDLVTRDGTDVQRVVEAISGTGAITVECVKEPAGKWIRVGDREFNMCRRYQRIGEDIDGSLISAPPHRHTNERTKR